MRNDDSPAPFRTRRLGREGMALPMVLMGLILVTLLVTTTMYSGATEASIGVAHQNANNVLYEADAALEWYLASRATQRLDIEPGTFERTLPTGLQARFTTSLLSDAAAAPGRPRVWHVTAEPAERGGRAVGAMVHTMPLPQLPAAPEAGAALTLGITAHVHPSSGTSGPRLFGRPSPGICADTVQQPIVVLSATAAALELHGGPNPPWPGEQIILDSRDQPLLAAEVTQDTPLSRLATLADFRFGPLFGEPRWQGSPSASNLPVGSNPRNWGCPAGMGVGCDLIPGASTLWPIVAIDGSGRDVDLFNGIHGQGVLIIVNGNLHVHAPFHWKGLIIVDGAINLHGGSGSGTANEIRIEGAVVALGNMVGGRQVKSRLTEQSLIRYNACAVRSAQRQISNKADRLDEGDVIMFTPYARAELMR
jgi:hypothetical protein